MDNRTLEKSILDAMEGTDIGLVKYLPYILQDFWEIGTSAEEVVGLVRKHKPDCPGLGVLDLGSGKGAVSVKMASELKCRCLGIDAIADFVAFSQEKAREFSVEDLCTFETGDVRTRLETLGKYDVIILGATGPLFGDYLATLSRLAPHLNDGGIVIVDEAYVEDGRHTDYPGVLPKSELLRQIRDAGMEIVEELTINDVPGTAEGYDGEFRNLEKRCLELIEKHPGDGGLLREYIEVQKKSYGQLLGEVTPVMLVLRPAA